MPNEDVKFSELPVGTLASDSIFATSENDGNGGLISTGVSAADVGNFTIDNLQYPLKLDTENKKVAGAINELHSSIGADVYDDTATYAVGDYCIHNNTLYKCTTAIITAEAWNVNHWTDTSIAEELDGKADTSDIPTKTSDLTNDSGFPVATVVSWGTSLSINYIKSNFILFVGDRLFAIWFSGSGYSNVGLRNIGTNTMVSGSGSATNDGVTVTRTTNGFKVDTSSNATITVMG